MISTIRILFSITLIAVLCCLPSGCEKKEVKPAQTPTAAKTPDALKPLEVLIDWQAEPTYLGVYYAKSLGLFKDLGLDVTVVQGRGANQAAAAVAAGTYKIATASGGATVLGRNDGKELVSLGVIYPRVSTVVYGLAKSGIKEPKDLVGKKIGIYPGSITKNEFDAFVKLNQITLNPDDIISLSGADVPLLKSGKLDAVLQYGELSPVLVGLDTDVAPVDGMRAFELALADYGVSCYGLNVITSRATYQADGELVKKIAEAIFEGYRRGCADPEKAVAAFKVDFPQMDAEYIRQSWMKVCQTVGGNYGMQSREGWQATIDMYKSLGLLKADVKPEEVMP